MKVGIFRAYKGIVGTIEINSEGHYGKLLNINGFVDYYGDSLEQLEMEFHKTVDMYLEIIK